MHQRRQPLKLKLKLQLKLQLVYLDVFHSLRLYGDDVSVFFTWGRPALRHKPMTPSFCFLSVVGAFLQLSSSFPQIMSLRPFANFNCKASVACKSIPAVNLWGWLYIKSEIFRCLCIDFGVFSNYFIYCLWFR